MQDARNGGTSASYIKEYLHKNGHRVEVVVQYVSLKDTPGHVITVALPKPA